MRRILELHAAVAIMAAIALLPPGVAPQNARSGGTVTASSSIQAIRYAFAPDDVADLVMGAPKEKITLAMVVWLIRGGGRNILFDSDYHPRHVSERLPLDRIHSPRRSGETHWRPA